MVIYYIYVYICQGEEATFYLHSSVTRQLNLGQSVSQSELNRNWRKEWAAAAKALGAAAATLIGPQAHLGLVLLSSSVVAMIMTPFKEQVSQPAS